MSAQSVGIAAPSLFRLDFGLKVAVQHIEAPIDIKKFEAFERQFRKLTDARDALYRAIPGGSAWPSFEPPREKILEYYLTLEALNFSRSDVYLDAASCLSLFPNYLAEARGTKVIRQDLNYKPGTFAIHCPRVLSKSLFRKTTSMICIGSDACAIPLPDASVDAIGLHCSLEHFENDADGVFGREACRLLRPGGRLFIIPFYCGDQYTEIFKQEYAVGCQFHRYYDPPSFVSRVLEKLSAPVVMEIRYYRNVRQIDPTFYCDYSACLVKR